jgi:hypothetical protein
MTVANSASLLQQGISIAQGGARELAQTYLRRAAEESPNDPNVWLWTAWLADSPADMAQCLEHLLAEHPDHSLAQDGLRWARGLKGDATGPDFSELDEADFKWTSIAAASPKAGEGQSHTVGVSAIENLGVAIAAVEELVLDTSPPRCYEDACDEFSSRPKAAPAVELPPSPPPTELFEADDSWTDSTEPLTSESPTSPLVNSVAEHPELPENPLEDSPSLATGDEWADGDEQFDADADVQVDLVVDPEPEAPVLRLPFVVERAPEHVLEPAVLELPTSREPQNFQVPENAPVADFVAEENEHPVAELIEEPPVVLDSSTPNTSAPSAPQPISDAAGVPSYENGLDNHSVLLLGSLKQQISILHKPTNSAGRQQTLLTARTILADTLEFLQKTKREELLLRNRDEVCRVHGEIKKVDQLLEWPSLLGMFGLRKASQQTPEQAYAEVGASYAALLDSLLAQIGTTFPGPTQAQWEASFRPLLADLKRLW